MKVLVGCEESGVMRRAFKAKRHEAYSNDLIPSRDGGEHLQMCVKDAINSDDWDLIILHPDCTKMAVSGNRWYGRGMPRNDERIEQVEWTVDLWNLAISRCEKVVLENPVSVIFPALNAHVQYIQPYQFGHGETKKTGLALHGLPDLIPTNNVEGREQRIWKMAPSATRKRDRSETYQGIADAMASQF